MDFRNSRKLHSKSFGIGSPWLPDVLNLVCDGQQLAAPVHTCEWPLAGPVWRDGGSVFILALLDLPGAIDIANQVSWTGKGLSWEAPSYLPGWFQLFGKRGNMECQRTWLSPCSFLISTWNQWVRMNWHGIKYHNYGDYKGTSLPWAAQTVKVHSQHLNTMWVWMRKNQLQFNPTKTGVAVDFNILSIWWCGIFNSGLDGTHSELVCSLRSPLDS